MTVHEGFQPAEIANAPTLLKCVWGVSLFLIFGLQFRLWAGEGSYAQVWNLQQQIEQQKTLNQRLAERNSKLDAEVIDLKNGRKAIEEKARNELGMVKKGETFILVIED